MKKILIPALLLTIFSSCSNYYKAITISEPAKAASFNNFQHIEKYYIIRSDKNAYAMKSINLSTDQKKVHCSLEALPPEHLLHLTNGRNGKMKYRKPDSAENQNTDIDVLNEVHIYLTPGIITEPGDFTFDLENIQKAEILEHDKVKTRKSYTKGTIIGIISSIIGVGIIIVAILASSVRFY